jgi:hypothetical protein
VRTVDFREILDEATDLAEFRKSIVCLFNEYRVVLEGGLYEMGIPFVIARSSNGSLAFDGLLKVGH